MEHEQDLRTLLVRSAHDLGLNLTEQHIAQFLTYLSQLIRWNETINLTGIADPEEIVIKHFIDSLTALSTIVLPQQAILADVGSGAGFPGIPLKIVRSDLRLRLVETNQKKCSFLATVIGHLKLAETEVFRGTLTQYCTVQPEVAGVATIRALQFDDIAEHFHNLLRLGGLAILYRTSSLSLKEVKSGFRLLREKKFSLPNKSGNRVISVLEKV